MDRENEVISITISGKSAVGKSTVLALINNTLAAHGYTTQFERPLTERVVTNYQKTIPDKMTNTPKILLCEEHIKMGNSTNAV